MRKNTVRNLTVKKREFTGDEDPQQDVGEDGQKGSQQLNWAITDMNGEHLPAGTKDILPSYQLGKADHCR